MELAAIIAKSQETLRSRGGVPVESGHGCEDGWVYDEHGARPCPTCAAKDAEASLTRALQLAGVGERYFAVTWDDLEMVEPLPALRTAAGSILGVIESGHNALFSGKPGAGKTQAAVLLLRAAIQAGRTAALENIGRAAMTVRAGYDGEGVSEADLVNRLSRVDLLVLDDIGAGEAGEGKLEKRLLYFITEARQNARKPTILTSNLTGRELAGLLEERVVNRLMPLEVFNFAHGRNFRAPAGGTKWRAS